MGIADTLRDISTESALNGNEEHALRLIATEWEQLEAQIKAALNVISNYGAIDGGHHKQWVLDQVVRVLKGKGYDAWVAEQEDGEDGPHTYDWDTGVAP